MTRRRPLPTDLTPPLAELLEHVVAGRVRWQPTHLYSRRWGFLLDRGYGTKPRYSRAPTPTWPI